jgi:hypothetical protein
MSPDKNDCPNKKEAIRKVSNKGSVSQVSSNNNVFDFFSIIRVRYPAVQRSGLSAVLIFRVYPPELKLSKINIVDDIFCCLKLSFRADCS